MKVGKKMYSIYGKDFGPKKIYFDNDTGTKLIKLFIVITEINHLVKKRKRKGKSNSSLSDSRSRNKIW